MEINIQISESEARSCSACAHWEKPTPTMQSGMGKCCLHSIGCSHYTGALMTCSRFAPKDEPIKREWLTLKGDAL